MVALSLPDEGVVEVRLRAVLPNAEGQPTDVFLGYRFTWDTQLGKWRWIQTCVYSRPGDGPFATISPI